MYVNVINVAKTSDTNKWAIEIPNNEVCRRPIFGFGNIAIILGKQQQNNNPFWINWMIGYIMTSKLPHSPSLHFHSIFPQIANTPVKLNMEPQNQSLEKEIPIGNHHFQVQRQVMYVDRTYITWVEDLAFQAFQWQLCNPYATHSSDFWSNKAAFFLAFSYQTTTGWWFQPDWHILYRQIGSSPRVRVKIRNA